MQVSTLILLLTGIFSIQAYNSFNQQNMQAQQPQNAPENACATIPDIGSPILIIGNAQQYIEDALNIKNSYTLVKYIYYSQTPSTTVPGQNTYRLVFTVSDYYSTKYIAVEMLISPFGIGSGKINKFLMADKFEKVKNIIGNDATENNSINCGDLKFIYSSHLKNDNDLRYGYPQNNKSQVGLAVLNELNITNNKAVKTRNCVTANYIETNNFFGTNGTSTPSDLINCVPNKNPVVAIMIGCNANTVSSLQLLFNNYNNNGATLSGLAGNPDTPVSAMTTISLGGVDRISFTSTTTPLAIKIQTLDINNNVITNYQCGIGVANPQNLVVSAYNFLGLTNIFANDSVTSFEVTQYRGY